MQNRNRPTDIENKFMVTKVESGWRGISYEYGTNRYTLLHIKQISNRDLLYSTGNDIQYLVIIYNGKEYEKKMYN